MALRPHRRIRLSQVVLHALPEFAMSHAAEADTEPELAAGAGVRIDDSEANIASASSSLRNSRLTSRSTDDIGTSSAEHNAANSSELASF